MKFKHRNHRRGAQKRSRVDKRSLRINGSNTSVTLEDAFWNALREIAAVRNIRVSELISTIKNRTPTRQQPFVRDSLVRSRLLPAASLMTPNPKQPPGPPMTLGNMRHLGVHRLIAYCLNPACRHEGLIDVAKYADDDVEVPFFSNKSFAPSVARVVGTLTCGRIGKSSLRCRA